MSVSLRFFVRASLLAVLVTAGAGCDLFEVEDRADPNGPSRDEILANPTQAVIGSLAVGVEASSRLGLGAYLTNTGVLGREYWVTSSADPRLTADLLGKGTSVLDDNTFYITIPWAAHYRVVRNATTMQEAIAANTTLSTAQKAAGTGWAKTWAAYAYLLNLNLTFEGGIRILPVGAETAGPPLSYAASLDAIADLLDSGAADLAAGGSAFFFPVSSGLAGFDTPATFREVNRALAARVALYQSDETAALAFLAESFLDDEAAGTVGAYHVFGTGSGDVLNPFFLPPTNTAGNAHLAHPSIVAGFEAGDTRASKVLDRGETLTFDGLSSSATENVYTSSLSPIPIVRNAELRLIRAEARARTGNVPGAIADLNSIRAAAGLPAYAGAATETAVVDEVLRQRLYELYAEGHRWLDLRRLGLLGTLPIDRPDDDVWDRFPLPDSEGT